MMIIVLLPEGEPGSGSRKRKAGDQSQTSTDGEALL